MFGKLDCDTFVFSGTMLEEYTEGRWSKDDLTKQQLEQGLLFKPNTNLLYNEFLNYNYDKNKRFCVTVIDYKGYHKSFSDLTYDDAVKIIEEYKDIVFDEMDITIFDMADAISFYDYEKELIKKNIKKLTEEYKMLWEKS